MDDVVIEETAKAGVYRRRRLSLTEKWVRAGEVDASLHTAALTFAAYFEQAQVRDRYAASNLERVGSQHRSAVEESTVGVRARRELAAAMREMGAMAGAVVWDVVGNEMSLREYVNRQPRPMTVNEAKGLLKAGLDRLADFYRLRQ
jgi:hypothetical protein